MNEKSTNKERIIRISRRTEIKTWQKAVAIASALLSAFLLCGIVVAVCAPGSFLDFYSYFFTGVFISADSFLNLLWDAAFLFLIALALTPVFKMKYWNIGAEGQCLMGGLGALIGLYFIAPHVPLVVALLIEILFAVIFAVVWALIPGIFKAIFNTNETLFTLMMNYVAMGFVSAFILANKNTSTGTIDPLYPNEHFGWIPISSQFNNSYIINIIVVLLIAFVVWVYMKFSKHGYEISVVGSSRNTAKYIGIDVKKVIIRTVVVTGVICGIVGFLCVAGNYHTLTKDAIGGRGFTAIIICWIGNFSVPVMAGYSFLIGFVSVGCKNANSWLHLSDKLANISVAIFFIALLVSTFFINFNISIKIPKDNKIVKFFTNLFHRNKQAPELEGASSESSPQIEEKEDK